MKACATAASTVEDLVYRIAIPPPIAIPDAPRCLPDATAWAGRGNRIRGSVISRRRRVQGETQ